MPPNNAKEIPPDDIDKLVAEAQANQAAGTPPIPIDIDDEDDEDAVVAEGEEGIPSWAKVPEGFKFPPGWTIWFIRFRAKLTNKPRGEDRQCILWNLSESDEKRATKLARGEGLRIIDEMAKAMIRSIDGKKVSIALNDMRAGEGFASVTAFWSEIGGKCRAQLKSLYLKNHTMDVQESADFFEHCVAPRAVG